MHRFVASVRWLLVALLVLPAVVSFGGPSAVAQSSRVDPAFYESELSGIEIEIDDDAFEIYEAEVQNYRHGQGEIVEIASNTAYIQVAFFDDTDTNEETLEIYNDAFSSDVDDFEVLDEGADGETVFTFAVATYNGVEFYYYLSVTADVEDNVDILQRIFSTDATFFDDFADAQDAISIGRDGFLEDVDVRDLEDLTGTRTTRVEEPTQEPEEEPTEATEAEPTEEPVSTIDPADAATVRDLVVVDAQLVATDRVQIAPGGAEAPAYEEIPMQFGEGEANLILLMRPESPEATLDFVLSIFTPEGGELQNVGTDADQTSAWSLDLIEEGADEFLLYVHVQNDRFQRFHYTEILIAPVDQFSDVLDGFSENVQIDGVPLFHESDRETIDYLLSGGEEPDSRDRRGDEDQQEDEVDKREVEDEDEDRQDRDGGLDLESQGLVSDTEYVSPQYDITVEWDDEAWVVDTEWEISAVSDTETGVDSVILFSLQNDASMMIQILPNDGAEPEEYVQVWESDDYIVEYVHEDGEVLLSDSSSRSGGVVYLTYTAEGDELILTQEMIYLDEDVAAIVLMYSTPDEASDAYADAEDFVTVDGNDAAGAFTPREIDRAVNP